MGFNPWSFYIAVIYGTSVIMLNLYIIIFLKLFIQPIRILIIVMNEGREVDERFC